MKRANLVLLSFLVASPAAFADSVLATSIRSCLRTQNSSIEIRTSLKKRDTSYFHNIRNELLIVGMNVVVEETRDGDHYLKLGYGSYLQSSAFKIEKAIGLLEEAQDNEIIESLSCIRPGGGAG